VFQRAVFQISMFALLVGAPLAVVALLAKPDISGTAVDPEQKLRRGDIRNWPAFVALLDPDASHEEAAVDSNLTADVNNLRPREIARTRSIQLREKLDIMRSSYFESPTVIQFGEPWYSQWPRSGLTDIYEYMTLQRQIEADEDQICQALNDGPLNSKSFPWAVIDGNLLEPDRQLTADDLKDGAHPKDNPSEEAKEAELRREKAKDSQAGMFASLRVSLQEQKKQSEVVGPNLDEEIEDARLSYRAISNDRDIRGFNLTILRRLRPACFYTEDKAYRWLVIAGDEMTRVWIFALSSLVFVLSGLCINFNTTSLHRFYRNRLQHAYLSPQLPGGDRLLHDMKTTERGHPYHLINATIDMSRPRFLDDLDQECANLDADRRDVQNFLFSQLYCGSAATGWADTKAYEKLRDDNISLADAIALSGSAIDPFRAGSLGLTVAMSVLNLTLGQWLPNPSREKGPSPTFFALLRDWCKKPEERTFCYVSDGGFTDNLGIMSLLRRRCRLIIAVDASCDGNQAYTDLNWVIRAARLNDGIKIIESRKSDSDAEVVLNTSSLDVDAKGLCERHFLLARVVYPENPREPAWLVYLKPSFTGDEGADLLRYRRDAPNFPNDDTVDQFYEPARAESYRQLGFHIADDFCRRIIDTGARVLLTGVERLEPKIAAIREEADHVKQTRRNLPMAAKIALSIGKRVRKLIRENLDHARDGEGHRREFEQSVKMTLETIGSRFATEGPSGQHDNAYRTGDRCEKAGVYRSSCDVCPRIDDLDMAEGMLFPTCQCGEPATWKLLV